LGVDLLPPFGNSESLANFSGGIEIVSPVMTFGIQDWRSQVKQTWEIIRASCFIETDETCSTHVHISPPGSQEWDTKSLQSVCHSIFYFENAIEVLVPKIRRGNFWAKSNWVDNPKFRGKNLTQCFELIDQCSKVVEIADLMTNNGDRYYGWNFKNLYHGGTMTIEFRRGPGVTEVEHCLAWVEFALTFMRAAKTHGKFEELKKYPRNVEGLHAFMKTSVFKGVNRPELLESIFKGKSGSLQPTPIVESTGEKKKKEDAKKAKVERKNLMREKMEQLTKFQAAH
jgi:Putative amidoligase enzyme